LYRIWNGNGNGNGNGMEMENGEENGRSPRWRREIFPSPSKKKKKQNKKKKKKRRGPSSTISFSPPFYLMGMRIGVVMDHPKDFLLRLKYGLNRDFTIWTKLKKKTEKKRKGGS
jgi:hypothetical protein